MWRPEHKEIPAAAKNCPVLKSLHGCCEEPTHRYLGKADDLWEEMSTSTADITVVWGQASTERYAEITSGRTISQQGLATTCKDRLYKVRSRKQEEGFGLAHEPVRAMKGSNAPRGDAKSPRCRREQQRAKGLWALGGPQRHPDTEPDHV